MKLGPDMLKHRAKNAESEFLNFSLNFLEFCRFWLKIRHFEKNCKISKNPKKKQTDR